MFVWLSVCVCLRVHVHGFARGACVRVRMCARASVGVYLCITWMSGHGRVFLCVRVWVCACVDKCVRVSMWTSLCVGQWVCVLVHACVCGSVIARMCVCASLCVCTCAPMQIDDRRVYVLIIFQSRQDY